MEYSNRLRYSSAAFFMTGISFRQSDVAIRSRYSLSTEKMALLYASAKSLNAKELFIISTCNRTEIYCLGSQVNLLLTAWCEAVHGDIKELSQYLYIHRGQEAITHLLKVGCGIDSQILGDYEITGQIKQSFKLCRMHQTDTGFMERLINVMLQASKLVRNQTSISKGSVSVASFAVKYIHDYLLNLPNANILLIGTGKIGLNTLKGLNGEVPASQICVMNRTDEKAAEIASDLNLVTYPFSRISEALNMADVVIVATNAPEPIASKIDFSEPKPRLLLDLSVPRNIDDNVLELNDTMLLDVDKLSRYTDDTISKRSLEIPPAMFIIEGLVKEFMGWIRERNRYAQVERIKVNMLQHEDLIAQLNLDRDMIAIRCREFFINKAKQQADGCHYIQLVNELLEPAGQL